MNIFTSVITRLSSFDNPPYYKRLYEVDSESISPIVTQKTVQTNEVHIINIKKRLITTQAYNLTGKNSTSKLILSKFNELAQFLKSASTKIISKITQIVCLFTAAVNSKKAFKMKLFTQTSNLKTASIQESIKFEQMSTALNTSCNAILQECDSAITISGDKAHKLRKETVMALGTGNNTISRISQTIAGAARETVMALGTGNNTISRISQTIAGAARELDTMLTQNQGIELQHNTNRTNRLAVLLSRLTDVTYSNQVQPNRHTTSDPLTRVETPEATLSYPEQIFNDPLNAYAKIDLERTSRFVNF